jgi:hypothetical protein
VGPGPIKERVYDSFFFLFSAPCHLATYDALQGESRARVRNQRNPREFGRDRRNPRSVTNTCVRHQTHSTLRRLARIAARNTRGRRRAGRLLPNRASARTGPDPRRRGRNQTLEWSNVPGRGRVRVLDPQHSAAQHSPVPVPAHALQGSSLDLWAKVPLCQEKREAMASSSSAQYSIDFDPSRGS